MAQNVIVTCWMSNCEDSLKGIGHWKKFIYSLLCLSRLVFLSLKYQRKDLKKCPYKTLNNGYVCQASKGAKKHCISSIKEVHMTVSHFFSKHTKPNRLLFEVITSNNNW